MKYFSWFCTLLLLCSCQEAREKIEIRNVCNKFMEGRIAFDKGDETMLKEVTSDSLFLVIQLNEEYSKVLRAGGAKSIREDIKKIKVTDINYEGNCAICNTNLKEYYLINLCKEDSVWKVQGENYKYPTVGQIRRTKDKIQKQQEYLIKKPAIDSVLKTINSFHKAVKTYFLTDDINTLSETCDAATFSAVKSLYYYTKKINKLEELKEEIKFPKALATEPLFEEKKVKAKFYKEETYINLIKTNNTYTITGLNNIDADQITISVIHKEYLNLLRALYLLRTKTYWKNMKFMADVR